MSGKWWKEGRKIQFYPLFWGKSEEEMDSGRDVQRGNDEQERPLRWSEKKEGKSKIISGEKYEKRRDVRNEVGEAKQNGSILRSRDWNLRKFFLGDPVSEVKRSPQLHQKAQVKQKEVGRREKDPGREWEEATANTHRTMESERWKQNRLQDGESDQ